MGTQRTALAGAIVATLFAAAGSAAGPAKTIASLDLSRPLATRSAWRLVATQGPDTTDTPSADTEPGAIRLCLTRDGGKSCQPGLDRTLAPSGKDENDTFAQPHYMAAPTVVHPADGASLLRIDLASLHGGNGDQLRALLLLAYDRGADAFRIVFRQVVGRNNNQEARYIGAGPLRGSVIVAEPTQDAPFGYWITVSRYVDAAYRQVLRFRSATRYGDGNPLGVIDAEMPGILRRLGAWRPGQPLPAPARGCPKPHLRAGALWC